MAEDPGDEQTRIGELTRGTSKWPLSPENLSRVFGGSSDMAKSLVPILFDFLQGPSKRIAHRFQEWQTNFGQVFGTEKDQSPEILKWADSFQISLTAKTAIPNLFFCIHTYFALILKLLCTDILNTARQGEFRQFSEKISKGKDVYRLICQLEEGTIFTQYGISNFLDNNSFSWYLDHWNNSLESGIRALSSNISRFEPTSANLAFYKAGDLFKQLYQNLVPDKVRHSFGEYYTPDWLAEYVIRTSGYNGNPKKRVLDPCCGSGTFLIKALQAVMDFLQRSGSDIDLIDYLNDAHILGLDLNPIAVLAAKANLILFVAEDLGKSAKTLTLPVFLRDVIDDPEIDEQPGEPTFDFIIGNPPWVKWSNLPKEYREKIQPICKRYDLFSTDAWVGGIESDISTVISFISAERWLKTGGILAFLLPQTVFQTASAEGFRKFRLLDKNYLKVRSVEDLTEIKPFDDAQNETALLIAEKSLEATAFPVPYRVWKKRTRGSSLPSTGSLSAILNQVEITDLKASPMEENHLKWMIVPPGKMGVFNSLMRQDGIKLRARKGTTTDFNNIFWVKVIGTAKDGLVMVRNGNCTNGHSITPIVHLMEEGILYPLIRGTEVTRFKVGWPKLAIIMPQKTMHGFEETLMQQQYPNATKYFEQYRDQACSGCRASIACRKGLSHRACFMKYHTALKQYWAIWNVGDYTFSPYKLVWREIGGKTFFSAVLEPMQLDPLVKKCSIPDHKLMMVPFENRHEAHFYCALLNSRLIREFAVSITTDTSHGTRIFDSIRFPPFDGYNKEHRLLASLSMDVHCGKLILDEGFERQLEKIALKITTGLESEKGLCEQAHFSPVTQRRP